MKSENSRLHFIASSFWISISYFSQFRAIVYCSNISWFFAILMHGSCIPNWLIIIKWMSNIFILLHFCKNYESITCVQCKKTLSLPAATGMMIVVLILRHTKNWFIFSASIWNWNCNKSSFLKWGRRGRINVCEDEVEPSYFLHCI